MLRSRLEQQLAEATFDGEDIDEEAYIRPLKLKDSVPKYRVPIQKILAGWLEDDALLTAMSNAALQDRRGSNLNACRSDLLRRIFWVKERYDNIEHEFLDEIDGRSAATPGRPHKKLRT